MKQRAIHIHYQPGDLPADDLQEFVTDLLTDTIGGVLRWLYEYFDIDPVLVEAKIETTEYGFLEQDEEERARLEPYSINDIESLAEDIAKHLAAYGAEYPPVIDGVSTTHRDLVLPARKLLP